MTYKEFKTNHILDPSKEMIIEAGIVYAYNRSSYMEVINFLKTTMPPETYGLIDADFDGEEARIDRTYQQIEILDGRFTIEYDIHVMYYYYPKLGEWRVYNVDIFFQELYKLNDPVMVDELTKKTIIDLLIKKIEVTC